MRDKEFIEVAIEALGVFDSHEQWMKWMLTPCKPLGDKRPIDCDSLEVIKEINRIAHGVYG